MCAAGGAGWGLRIPGGNFVGGGFGAEVQVVGVSVNVLLLMLERAGTGKGAQDLCSCFGGREVRAPKQ